MKVFILLFIFLHVCVYSQSDDKHILYEVEIKNSKLYPILDSITAHATSGDNFFFYSGFKTLPVELVQIEKIKNTLFDNWNYYFIYNNYYFYVDLTDNVFNQFFTLTDKMMTINRKQNTINDLNNSEMLIKDDSNPAWLFEASDGELNFILYDNDDNSYKDEKKYKKLLEIMQHKMDDK